MKHLRPNPYSQIQRIAQTHISCVNMMYDRPIFPLKMLDDNTYFYDSLIHLKFREQQCDSQGFSDRVQDVNTLCKFPG